MGGCHNGSGFENISIPTDYKGMRVICYNWKSTYSNLFDYTAQSSQYEVSYVNILKSCNITRDGNKIVSKQLIQKTKEDVLKITLQNNQHIILPSQNLDKVSANQLWLVVKSTPSQKYKLKEGDIMRIGKQKVKVKEIIIGENQAEDPKEVKTKFTIYDNLTKQNSQGFNFDKDKKQGDIPVCRVCLDEGQIDNPLIAPCRCSGSAKYIHIKCIQQWFQKTLNPRTINSVIVISWKPLVCELCNQHLAFKIYLDENKHFTVNIPRPQKPYLVLNPVEKGGKTKTYFLISFAKKKKLSIGRKHESDIVMDQCTSISRFHSFIQFDCQKKKSEQKPRFLLSDNDSKFGTMVLLSKPINFQEKYSGLQIQFGGNILGFLLGKDKHPHKNQWQSSDELNDSESSEQSQEEEQEEQSRR